MRLLVLRPEPDASDTAARLRALGHEVLVEPLLRVDYAPPPIGLPMPAAIVVTSRNAVRALAGWPQAAEWHDRPVFAVGMETAAAARAAGFRDLRVGGGDADRLAEMIMTDFDKSAGIILHPAPRDRAADLAERLSDAGFAVRRIEAYRAIAAERLADPVVAALRAQRIDGILFLSRRTATVFADLARRAGVAGGLGRTRLFALSEAIAGPLRELGSGEVRVAGQPDADSLFALLPPGD